MPDEKEFARGLEWGRDRVFPELGVIVRVERPQAGGEGVIFVREIVRPKLKRLTRDRPKP